MKTTTNKVAVVGLGYVGLPLAVAFGTKIDTVGFDVNEKKVASILRGVDPTREMSVAEIKAATGLSCTTNPEKLGDAEIIIIAVPTPIDTAHQTDFGPLASASKVVGRNMKKGVTVVYESTVYPGATEEVCAPILERESGMKWKIDFHLGYSPERINPGDHQHRLETIIKVVAGDDAETLEKVARLYELVV